MECVLMVLEADAYRAWREAYDRAIDLRRKAGEKSFRLLRHESDGDHLVHFSQWTSLDDARAFLEGAELAAIMGEAGVRPPEIIYLRQVEDGGPRSLS